MLWPKRTDRIIDSLIESPRRLARIVAVRDAYDVVEPGIDSMRMLLAETSARSWAVACAKGPATALRRLTLSAIARLLPYTKISDDGRPGRLRLSAGPAAAFSSLGAEPLLVVVLIHHVISVPVDAAKARSGSGRPCNLEGPT